MNRLRFAPVPVLSALLAVAGCAPSYRPPAQVVPATGAARATPAPGIESTNAVPFDAGRADLSEDARRRLEAWAAALRRDRAVKLTIIGHGDQRNTRDYDLALGAQRAEAIKNYLLALGVDDSQLYTTTYGKERPAVAAGGELAAGIDSRATVVVESLAEAPQP